MMLIKKRQGSVLLMVLVIAACMGMLALSYYRVARESRHSEKWHELRNTAEEAAIAIHEEAYATLLKDLKNPKSQLFWFLLGAVSGARNDMRLPFSRQHLEKILPDGFACNFDCELKVVSFKSDAPEKRSYAGKHEGHGILAIMTRVEIVNKKARRKVPVSRHYLEIHHDYLVASMLSPGSDGSALKNVLLLRKQRDFDGLNKISADTKTLLTFQTDAPSLPQQIENLRVFNRFSLWARRDLSLDDLQRLRIMDTTTRTLNLNGINHCRGAINLRGEWQIHGQGVLIADSFTIDDSVKKVESSDIAVLFARRGNIRINTKNEIHAALIAINESGTGTVESTSPLNLNGMILADRINMQNWSGNEHIVVYDPILADADKAYQISVSRWVNFRRSGETS